MGQTGGEQRKRYTSTSTQCDLGDQHLMPRDVAVGPSPDSETSTVVEGKDLHMYPKKEVESPDESVISYATSTPKPREQFYSNYPKTKRKPFARKEPAAPQEPAAVKVPTTVKPLSAGKPTFVKESTSVMEKPEAVILGVHSEPVHQAEHNTRGMPAVFTEEITVPTQDNEYVVVNLESKTTPELKPIVEKDKVASELLPESQPHPSKQGIISNLSDYSETIPEPEEIVPEEAGQFHSSYFTSADLEGTVPESSFSYKVEIGPEKSVENKALRPMPVCENIEEGLIPEPVSTVLEETEPVFGVDLFLQEIPEEVVPEKSLEPLLPGDVTSAEKTEELTELTPKRYATKKRLVKQHTLPASIRELESVLSERKSETIPENTEAAIEVRRSTLPAVSSQKRRFSYQEKRQMSIEKLKSSMEDVELILGRRKSKVREMLLSQTDVDYHAFLIWIMFSEGELNNVKRVSATYTVLLEQKMYLQVTI